MNVKWQLNLIGEIVKTYEEPGIYLMIPYK